MWRCFGSAKSAAALKEIYLSKSKLDGYRSSAAYTLIDLNQRYSFLKPGQKVLDIGAAPGSWSQVAVSAVKSDPSKPSVLSIDIATMSDLPGAKFINLDVTKPDAAVKLFEVWTEPVDVVLSDLTGNLVGDRDIDCAIISNLNLDAMGIAKRLLKPGGTMLLRSQRGYNEPDHFTYVKSFFVELQRVLPSIAVEDEGELFYLGTGWLLQKSKEKDASSTENQLRVIAQMAKASGVKLEGDIKDMLNETLKEGLGDAKGQFAFLGSDESTLEQTEKEMQTKLSFNFEVPKDPKDFEEMMKRLEKEHPAGEDEKPPGFESGDDEPDAEDAKLHDEGSASGQEELPPEEKSEYRDLLRKVMNKRTELDEDDSAEAESIRREISKLEHEMNDGLDENPDYTERTKEQKTQFEKWRKALKDKDIWGDK